MTTPARALRQILESGRTIWSAGAYDALSAILIDRAGFDAVAAGVDVAQAQLSGASRALRHFTRDNDEMHKNVYYHVLNETSCAS